MRLKQKLNLNHKIIYSGRCSTSITQMCLNTKVYILKSDTSTNFLWKVKSKTKYGNVFLDKFYAKYFK